MKPLAFVSVSDKRGLAEFAGGLVEQGWEVVSTGGTARALRAAGLGVTEVSELTEWPEALGGRVKALHPRVFGGILADLDEPEHRAVLADWKARPIAIVAVNLYPFVATASRADVSAAEVIENIDIGGPSLLRAAAKNHKHVTVVVDPDDYGRILAALAAGGIPVELRQELALKAFQHTASYDLAISAMLPRHLGAAPSLALETLAPWLGGEEVRLRYGENPHQQAVLVRHRDAHGLAAYRQIQGKELSYNNLVDADGAWRLVHDLPGPGVAIVKHASPCGVALGPTVAAAYSRALACDPVSAFGGVIASSRPCDGEAARKITEIFAEVVVLPDADEDARAVLATKKNLRVLLAPPPMAGGQRIRAIDGGLLIQTPDEGWDAEEWRTVTARTPGAGELAALQLAWRVAKHATSNAIVVADAEGTVGIGAGQPSRVDSCRIALERARSFGLATAGTAAGSDAFFPFPDGVETLAAGGVTAIVHPGGSMRDSEVIAAADRLGVAMVFTGRRHFPALGMLAGVLVALLAANPGGDASLEQVAAALRRSPCWHSEFTQRYVPAGFETGASESGTLTVAFPARLRFDYAGGAPRVFATDGAIARHVDPLAGSCTAVRLDAGTWGRLPLAAILDPGAARAAFAVVAAGRTLRLEAREPTLELASIEVVVDGTGLPQRVTVIDSSGNRNEFTFSSWKAYSEPTVDLFRPALPGAPPCSPDEG